jgi:hypothetical protein
LCLPLLPTLLLAGDVHTHPVRDSIPSFKLPSAYNSKSFLSFNGGYVSYNLNYRSTLDTPYFQKDLIQHSVTGNADFSVVGLPIKVWWLGRKSNSAYFRDIYDVRVEFNARSFREEMLSGYRQKLMARIDQLKDSLTEKYLTGKDLELKNLSAWLNNPLTLQRLVEMNEVIRIPAVTYDVTLPDSIARKRSDSLRAQAKEFMDLYESKKQQLNALNAKVDSLKSIYFSSINKINRLRSALKGNFNNWAELKQWKEEAGELTGNNGYIPKRYEWLMGIRNLSVGKAPVNYSELTAKNISINGVNFEYNSWYYFAVAAGFVDFRLRDFSLQRSKPFSQYLVMARAGIGELQRNHVIVSFLKGQKQLYRSNQGAISFPFTAMSVEARYQLLKSAYISAEVSQSQSPSFQLTPVAESKFWDFKDKSNKAFSLKLYSYMPRAALRLEGMYKYTGANYQSFNSFQSASGLYSWLVKAEQQLFNKQLKIVASARSNEFFNPYIVQSYKSNTVFKTLQASFRKRKWPAISLGYMPISQLTKIDNQVYENRFQTLTASVNHIYKLGVKQASTFVYTRFYSKQADSSFVFFNATNILFTQNIFFNDFNALIGISQTRNQSYLLNVLEGALDVPVSKKISVGVGSKLNSFNKLHVSVGYSSRINLRFGGADLLFVQFEKGYLPGIKEQLTRNDLLNAGLIKHFK